MPEGAAELAVGDGLKPVVRLLSDEAGDFRVLDGGQLLAGDFPRVKEAAGVDDGGSAQKGAYVIGAVGRKKMCHVNVNP